MTRFRRPRPRYAAVAVLVLATLVGPLAGWFTRGASRAVDKGVANDPGRGALEISQAESCTQLAPAVQPKHADASEACPFVVASTSKVFASLVEAFAAAKDGDTITVHGNGPFVTEPLASGGKALTIKAASGFRPVFRYASGSPDQALQPLIWSNKTLVLEGLELRRDGFGVSSAPQAPAFLLMSERAPLRIHDCSLLVPLGAGAIVCRDPGSLEMEHCTVASYALAVFVESTDEPCAVRLAGNTIDVTDPNGAAVCVCGPTEVHGTGPIQLHLEGNILRAGRLIAFQRLSHGIAIQACANHFTFRQALVSYRELREENGWRLATAWRGHNNRYVGATDWVQVDGAPAGVRGLQQWQALWGGPEPGSTDAEPGGAIHAEAPHGVATDNGEPMLVSFPPAFLDRPR